MQKREHTVDGSEIPRPTIWDGGHQTPVNHGISTDPNLNWFSRPNFFFAIKHMGVSKNSGTPKSSILKWFSLINHPFWGTLIFGNTHIIAKLCRWTRSTAPRFRPPSFLWLWDLHVTDWTPVRREWRTNAGCEKKKIGWQKTIGSQLQIEICEFAFKCFNLMEGRITEISFGV